jgi:hypothetical protein
MTVRPNGVQRRKLANLAADMTRKKGRTVSFNTALLSLVDKLPDPEQKSAAKKSKAPKPAAAVTEPESE